MLHIAYTPVEWLVDVFGIKDVIDEYIGSQTIRDIEYMLQHLADRLAKTLDVTTTLQAQVILDINQTMTIKAIASPS